MVRIQGGASPRGDEGWSFDCRPLGRFHSPPEGPVVYQEASQTSNKMFVSIDSDASKHPYHEFVHDI